MKPVTELAVTTVDVEQLEAAADIHSRPTSCALAVAEKQQDKMRVGSADSLGFSRAKLRYFGTAGRSLH